MRFVAGVVLKPHTYLACLIMIVMMNKYVQ